MKINRFYDKNLLLAILLALCFFVVAIIISLSQFIWLDEAYTLTTTSASIKQVWFRAINFEGQPPLYFILLRIWRIISDSVFFARLFSIITVTISIFIVYRLSEKYVTSIHPFLITLLFASNSIVLWAALEIRVYGLTILFAVLLIWLFLNTYTSKPKPILYKRLIFSIVALLSVYIQYYLAFILIGNFIFLIINKKWKIAYLYLLDMIIPVIGTVFLISIVFDQMSIHAYQNESTLSLLNLIIFQFKKISTYLFPLLNYFTSGVLTLSLFITIFSVVLFFARKNVKFQLNHRNYFLTISVVLLIFFTCLLFLTDIRNVAQRHTISLLLPLMMSLVLIIGTAKPAKIANTILVLMIMGNFVFDSIIYSSEEQKGIQHKIISDFIKANDDSNRRVFCFRYDIALVLKYGVPNHDVIPIPVNIDFDSHFDRRKWVLNNANQLDSLFTVNNINNGFWLVTSENDSAINKSIEKKFKIHYNYKLLNDYISENFYIEMEKQFSCGLTLRRITIPKKN